jgi:hypothetical protein
VQYQHQGLGEPSHNLFSWATKFLASAQAAYCFSTSKTTECFRWRVSPQFHAQVVDQDKQKDFSTMMLGASGVPMHINMVTPVTSHEVVNLQGSGKVRWLQKGWAQCRLRLAQGLTLDTPGRR